MRDLIARAPSLIVAAPSRRALAVAGHEPTATSASPKRTLQMAWTAATEPDAPSRLACRWRTAPVEGGVAR